ncbi:MAG: transporter substrate-binding domain-containing protein [Gammaproteobacteria bacterium]|nr:transporter substrate-binding domain-containing protein [Gammaproteobacteria bacterium]
MKIKPYISIIFLFFIFSFQATAETKLHITTGFTPPVSDFYRNILKEVDKRMPELSISFEVLPAERSLILSNQGVNDGECCRIPLIITRQYKNLIPVNHSFFSARFSAFAKKNRKPIEKFSELKPYSVGSVEGWKIAVNKVKEVEPAETHIVTTPEQMFQMLDKDRIDYGIVGYLSGLKSISNLKIKGIRAIDPPLIEKPLYIMLHIKHKNLIPEFNKVILNMKNDGTINLLYNQLLKSL